jgi:hypothetical protein
MMGLFSKDKTPEPKDAKNNTLMFSSSGVLPSIETIDKVTENKQIPLDIRKKYYHKDHVFAGLTSLNIEGIRKRIADVEIVDKIIYAYTPDIFFYTPGEDQEREFTDLKMHLIYKQALENSNVETGTPARDKFTENTSTNEVKTIDNHREIPKQTNTIKRLLGIGV